MYWHFCNTNQFSLTQATIFYKTYPRKLYCLVTKQRTWAQTAVNPNLPIYMSQFSYSLITAIQITVIQEIEWAAYLSEDFSS